MTIPSILLVHVNDEEGQLIGRAIEARLQRRPNLVTTGEAAVRWVGANTCSACVLDYQLPGIDGHEALLRIRERVPQLPVVLIADDGSPHLAAAVAQAGAAAYIPKMPGFQWMVAACLERMLALMPSESPSTTEPHETASVPTALLQPTYQNRLRSVGRQLDLLGHSAVKLTEVDHGFLIEAVLLGSREPVTLEVHDQDLPQLIVAAIQSRGRGQGERSAHASRLLPTGYEDFLRALGYQLDLRLAEEVTITELPDRVLVHGQTKHDGHRLTDVESLEMVLRPDDIVSLLEESYRRRAPRPSTPGQRTLPSLNGPFA